MKYYGIHYDVGTPTTHGGLTRATFDPLIVEREISIIKDDLHCNAIRIAGESIERLIMASQYALSLGLKVWFSPSLQNATPSTTLAYLQDCAAAAETLRLQSPSTELVFLLGVELSAFMRGLLEGTTPVERLQTLMNPLRLLKSTVLKGSFHQHLNEFLAQAYDEIRAHFHGSLSYGAGSWEKIDWTPFDFIGLDYYRDAHNKKHYEQPLQTYQQQDKPVVITEFGCCTYQGAADKGGFGWTIVDWRTTPPQLKQEMVRDEDEQADYLMDLLTIFQQQHLAGAFVFTFSAPSYPHEDTVKYDLDTASYSVVKTYSSRSGKMYPDMPWEPKEAFFRLAAAYHKIAVEMDPSP